MIETIVSVDLPVDEKLLIKRYRLEPEIKTGHENRISIVTASHGDELEGQYVCFKILNELKKNKDKIKGIIDVYPSLNPIGVDTITRNMPYFDVDVNRIFPGNENGSIPEYVASKIIDSLVGSDVVIDIHASNIFLREVPQVRMDEDNSKKLLPLAEMVNTDFIWIYPAITVLESTLAYSLNELNTPTLVVEMGVGMRVTQEYGDQLISGIYNIMKNLGIYETEEVYDIRKPIISSGENIFFLNSNTSGIFLPKIEHWMDVKKGDILGEVVDVLTGDVLEEVKSPSDGIVFTLREYPVVYEGSLLGRIYGNK